MLELVPCISSDDPGDSSESEWYVHSNSLITNALNELTTHRNNHTTHCLECTQLINPERLELFPNSNYCVKCQNILEKSGEFRKPQNRLSIYESVYTKENTKLDQDDDIAEEKASKEDCDNLVIIDKYGGETGHKF